MRTVQVLALAALAAGCGGERAPHEHPVIGHRPAPGDAPSAEARIRELTGSVTLEWWQATPDRFTASVTTRVAASFWVMAGRCDASGEIVVHEQRADYGPPSTDLGADDHTVIALPLAAMDGRDAPAPDSWYFEITAHDGDAALAQQIYSSGTCLENARQPSHSDREHGLLYVPLPPAKP